MALASGVTGEMTTNGEREPAWRQRAIDRSTQPARLRAAKRVQRFLNAAREIIAEKNSTEFTVQEVVDRSKQSLRSFYQYFDGKHELMLGLFEEEIDAAMVSLRAASAEGDPLDRLRAAVIVLYEQTSLQAGGVQRRSPSRMRRCSSTWRRSSRMLLMPGCCVQVGRGVWRRW